MSKNPHAVALGRLGGLATERVTTALVELHDLQGAH